MKKIVTLWLFCTLALTVSAQVAFLKVQAELPDYGGEQPEQNAYNWFKSTYGEGNVVDMNNIPTDASTYKVLWVNVERDISEGDFDNLFPTDKRKALSDYVKAGGNLLLTKKASRLATLIERISSYNPSWNNSGYNNGGDIWTINPILGQGKPDAEKRNAIGHPIFSGLNTEGNPYAWTTFPLVGAVKRSDDNIMWMAMNTSTHTYGSDTENENDLWKLTNFESDRNCQVLATWGQVTSYGFPTIIEFFPDATFKGSIITIGAAAYQWGTSNNYISNVQKLTENALNYLKQGGDTYGYYMPYTLSEVYSIDLYRPEYLSAKWFYDNYVTTGKGRFIHKEETFPSGMKVLWVHGDRINQNTGDFYNAMGGDGFKTKLKTFVEGGGNVFLSKQAARFANDIGRCSWAPSYLQTGYSGGSDVWFMVDNFVAVTGEGAEEKRNKHSHPVFRYMTDYAEHEEEGFCKWPLLNGEGTYQRSDHKYMWGEPGEVWNNTYSISNNSTDIGRLTSFETAQTCEILGGWGHTTALDGVCMVEFKPTDSYKGRVIALGLPAYQWTTSNTRIGNVQNLTKGVLQYLFVVDPRVPGCDNCFYYISE